MRISEFIAKLESLQAAHGDLEIETRGYDGDRVAHRGPEVAYRKIPRGRQRKPDFWFIGEDETQKGEKVIRV